MADDPLFFNLDSSTLPGHLVDMLCRIAKEKGRVEITNCDGGNCVMISKEELDNLENALELLSNTEQGRALHRSVERAVLMDDQDEPVPQVAIAP
jgi:PHD/YefM family antitoxin component YafN of YafNO toxin-antitoxin module